MHCLVLAPEADVHALAVEREVRELGGQCTILDVASLPLSRSISIDLQAQDPLLQIGEKVFSFGELSGVWNRRPSIPNVTDAVPQSDDAEFSTRSTNATLFGGLLSMCSNWINPLGARATAAYKPYQLRVAQKCGLRIPRSVVTSSPEAALAFHAVTGQTIYKTVTTWRYGLKETRILTQEDLANIASLRSCPTIFQEHIEGMYDVRATIVGLKVYAVAVHYLEGRSQVDGRLDRVPIHAINLPTQVQEQLLTMHRRLGLVYGAYDLRCTPSGDYVFFEVNPDGQYLYVETATDLPISRAIANALLGDG